MQTHPQQHDLLPPPHQITHADFEMVVRHLADDLAFGTDDSLFVGSGLEYAQSRPYEPGDPIKQIDWKITARIGQAYLKQYETLKRISIYLLVDTSSSMSVSSIALTKHDLAVWIASAIGLVGLRRLSPVGVVGAGERQTRLEPSLAQSDLWRAIEPLRAHGINEGTALADRLDTLDPKLSRQSLVVVISDLHDPNAIQSLRRIAHQHDVIAIHLEDPAETGELKAGFFRGSEAETGRTFIAGSKAKWRQDCQIARDLTGVGISYLHLLTNKAFLTPLRQFLVTRAVMMRGRN